MARQSGRNTIAAPRPKRAGEQFARGHDFGDEEDQPSLKKPRFDYRNPSTLAPDAPEEDTILELDEIGKGGAQTKRNAVNIDGYESDSSNDNFDARANEKAKLAKEDEPKSKQEEENDMFADLEEDLADGDQDEDLNKEGKKGKKVKFVNTEEIEGQESRSKGGGHVSADFSLRGKAAARDKDAESSSEDGDDEKRDEVTSDVDEELGAGAKKKHAPKLDAFNMRQEGEEGAFDENGNFVRKAADPDAVHDSWMEGLSKKDMKKAREAQEKRDEERRRRDMADDAIETSEVLKSIILRLEKGETILEALARLGKGKEKKKPKWQKNKRKNGDAMDVDAEAGDPAETKRKANVEAITAAADQMLTRGQAEVYDQERELLIRQWSRETGEPWVEPASNGEDEEQSSAEAKQWEYRWSDARDGGERHGPYDGRTMKSWNDAGYFGDGVEFRQVGEDGWSRAVDFV